MFCIVYRLHQNGEKLPKEVVRQQQPVEGWLYLGQCPKKYFPKRIAQLQAPQDRARLLLPELGDASVIGIKKGGLMIFGNEGFSASQPIWQRWWVVPGIYDDRLAEVAGPLSTISRPN